ncbi:MAG: hypothetical protein JWM92_288 [Candidatus Nomurabacteria bacterium]|nr:hypothetical protein [Candidatus Nomurabacteria bacterium]
MQKHKNISLAFIALSFFGVLFLRYAQVHAAGGGSPFGGRITATTATSVKTLENLNYYCVVLGSTINIASANGSPTSFYIPSSVKSLTGTSPTTGQNILGLYNKIPTPIFCIFKGYPVTVIPVFLPSITLWGTSV